MILVPIVELASELRPAYKLAPVPTITRAIRQSAIDFCCESLAVRETLPVIDIVVGVAEIIIDPGAQLVVQEIEEAWLDGKPLELSSDREVAIEMGDKRKQPGTPTKIYVSGLNKVILAPIPNKELIGGLEIKVSLKPQRSAVSIPEELAETYWPTIRDGAEAVLLSMTGEIWADISKAAFKENKVRLDTNKAKSRGQNSNTRRKKTVRYGGY